MASSTSFADLPSEVLETILAYLGRLQGSGAPRPAELVTRDIASLRLSCRYLRRAANESLHSLDIPAAKLCSRSLRGRAAACFDRFPAIRELRVEVKDACVLGLAPLVAQVPGLQSLTAYKGSARASMYGSTSSDVPVTLSPLTGLQALTALQLDHCKLDVEVLGSMAQLTQLALVDCTVTGAVTSLVHIRELNVTRSLTSDQARQTGSLSRLTRLQTAAKRHLQYPGSTTPLPDLSRLTGLCHLALSGRVHMASATSLRSLTGLTHLTTEFVSEPEALGSMATLRQLSTCCDLNKLPLAALSDLVDLTFGNIYADHLPAFSGVSSQLTRLVVIHWCVADFASLVALQRLRVLELEAGSWHASSLTSLGHILSLTGLQRLRLLDFHGLTNVDSLASLQALRELDLSYSPALKNISPVAGLNLLTSLVLTELGIHDTLAIQALTQLQVLTLAHCYSLTHVVCLTSLHNLASLTVAWADYDLEVAVAGTDAQTVQAPAQLQHQTDSPGHWWQLR